MSTATSSASTMASTASSPPSANSMEKENRGAVRAARQRLRQRSLADTSAQQRQLEAAKQEERRLKLQALDIAASAARIASVPKKGAQSLLPQQPHCSHFETHPQPQVAPRPAAQIGAPVPPPFPLEQCPAVPYGYEYDARASGSAAYYEDPDTTRDPNQSYHYVDAAHVAAAAAAAAEADEAAAAEAENLAAEEARRAAAKRVKKTRMDQRRQEQVSGFFESPNVFSL